MLHERTIILVDDSSRWVNKFWFWFGYNGVNTELHFFLKNTQIWEQNKKTTQLTLEWRTEWEILYKWILCRRKSFLVGKIVVVDDWIESSVLIADMFSLLVFTVSPLSIGSHFVCAIRMVQINRAHTHRVSRREWERINLETSSAATQLANDDKIYWKQQWRSETACLAGMNNIYRRVSYALYKQYCKTEHQTNRTTLLRRKFDETKSESKRKPCAKPYERRV